MQNIVNEPFLKKRAQFAKWGSLVGLAALFIGLMTTAQNPLLAYGLLLIGLFGATFGAYMASSYVREPRADQVVGNNLSGLDKRYAAYHYYLPANHVIASHFGLTVVVPRPQSGLITYQNGRWQHKAGWRKVLQFFGEPGLGKPERDITEEIKAVKGWIDEIIPEAEVPVNGVILFTNPQAELHAKESPIPAVKGEDLAQFMTQGLKGQPLLTTARQKELRRILDEVVEATKK
ncbi:MAG: hypothetical protein GX552_01980 [Chloroflexi bacterium]|jgi:hypothetical protein|nr:hypothetical protein [Chloroflexota bacterium]